jgi:hypothetical protein
VYNCTVMALLHLAYPVVVTVQCSRIMHTLEIMNEVGKCGKLEKQLQKQQLLLAAETMVAYSEHSITHGIFIIITSATSASVSLRKIVLRSLVLPPITCGASPPLLGST